MTKKNFDSTLYCENEKMKFDKKQKKTYFEYTFQQHKSDSVEDVTMKILMDSKAFQTGNVISIKGVLENDKQTTLDELLGFDTEDKDNDPDN